MSSEELTRREFLKKTAKGITFVGLAGKISLKLAQSKSMSSGDYDLAVAKGGNFASLRQAAKKRVKEAVNVFGGMSSFVKGKRVLIKVNAIDNKHQLGNTSSEVAEAVVKICRESGAKSVIIDAIKEAADEEVLTVLDSPPGTGCPMVESVNGCDFALLVTEPTPFGLNDVELATEVVKKLGIPAGIVINRSDRKEDIIIEEYCQKQDLPILMRIPMDRTIAEAYSEGKLLIDVKPQWEDKFIKLFDDIKAMLSKK